MGQANIFAMRDDKTQAKSRLAQLIELEPKLDRQTLSELGQQMHRRLRPTYDSLKAEYQQDSSPNAGRPSGLPFELPGSPPRGPIPGPPGTSRALP